MEELLKTVYEATVEKKAINPTILDVQKISNVTDYFLICSGNTPIQVRAITDNIIDKLRESGNPVPQKEGYQDGNWVLLDLGSIVVHIMNQRERDFYLLEQLWHDAKIIQ